MMEFPIIHRVSFFNRKMKNGEIRHVSRSKFVRRRSTNADMTMFFGLDFSREQCLQQSNDIGTIRFEKMDRSPIFAIHHIFQSQVSIDLKFCDLFSPKQLLELSLKNLLPRVYVLLEQQQHDNQTSVIKKPILKFVALSFKIKFPGTKEKRKKLFYDDQNDKQLETSSNNSFFSSSNYDDDDSILVDTLTFTSSIQEMGLIRQIVVSFQKAEKEDKSSFQFRRDLSRLSQSFWSSSIRLEPDSCFFPTKFLKTLFDFQKGSIFVADIEADNVVVLKKDDDELALANNDDDESDREKLAKDDEAKGDDDNNRIEKTKKQQVSNTFKIFDKFCSFPPLIFDQPNQDSSFSMKDLLIEQEKFCKRRILLIENCEVFCSRLDCLMKNSLNHVTEEEVLDLAKKEEVLDLAEKKEEEEVAAENNDKVWSNPIITLEHVANKSFSLSSFPPTLGNEQYNETNDEENILKIGGFSLNIISIIIAFSMISIFFACIALIFLLTDMRSSRKRFEFPISSENKNRKKRKQSNRQQDPHLKKGEFLHFHKSLCDVIVEEKEEALGEENIDDDKNKDSGKILNATTIVQVHQEKDQDLIFEMETLIEEKSEKAEKAEKAEIAGKAKKAEIAGKAEKAGKAEIAKKAEIAGKADKNVMPELVIEIDERRESVDEIFEQRNMDINLAKNVAKNVAKNENDDGFKIFQQYQQMKKKKLKNSKTTTTSMSFNSVDQLFGKTKEKTSFFQFLNLRRRDWFGFSAKKKPKKEDAVVMNSFYIVDTDDCNHPLYRAESTNLTISDSCGFKGMKIQRCNGNNQTHHQNDCRIQTTSFQTFLKTDDQTTATTI